MIIFTVTNKTTSQVYVGSTRNDLVDQWEKMVAAAEQNLSYPLYQEIRIHGRNDFTVEEWDYVEDRGELAALEQEAIEIFGAKSLRGYKTSTVKIEPKKKTRTRKSSIEKELANIFADAVAEAQEELTPNLAVKDNAKTLKATPQPKSAAAAKPAPAAKSKEQYSQAQIDELTRVVAEQNKLKEAPKKEAAREVPDNCSQANAVVQMSNINLSDDITAQLAAIQAAADAVLSGDTESAANLNLNPPVKKTRIASAEPDMSNVIAMPEPEPEPVPVPVVEICPKELHVREAIERHRKLRSQRTTEVQGEERKQIAKLLSDLSNRALAMSAPDMAAVA